MRRLFVALIVLQSLFIGQSSAEDTVDPNRAPDALRAENRALSATVARQAAEIERLKMALAAATRGEAAPPPAQPDATATPDGGIQSTPTTLPAGHPKRIVFILDFRGRMISSAAEVKDNVNRAMLSLASDQAFNFILFDGNVRLFKPAPVLPTRVNLLAAGEFLDKASTTGTGDIGLAIRAAAAQHADRVWFCQNGGIEPKELGPIIKSATAVKVSLNTAKDMATSAEPKAVENLWRVAHDTGGTCFDSDGKSFTWEAPKPAATPPRPTPPPDAPPKKSIFSN